MAETVLQNWIFTQFALPFLLIFFIAYGVLVKSKILGENKQLNAMTAFVIGLIFVGAIFPKMVVGNLILFLTVALVTMFVGLLLFGFVAGADGLKFADASKQLKWAIGFAILAAVALALIWATGLDSTFYDFVFRSSWSKEFWTNAAFIAVVIIALVAVIKKG